jgi:hypothetical protein
MKNLKQVVIVLIAGLVVTGVVVFANNTLTAPSGDPESTGITLDDIYHKLEGTATTTKSFNPTVNTSTSNFHDLGEIYDLLNNNPLDPNTFTASTTIMGVTGTYDISNLIPENVATGVTYGPNGSLVGTME